MCGSDKQYLHKLAVAVRSVLGRATVVYTTDPPWLLDKGSLAGTEVFTYACSAAVPAALLCPATVWHTIMPLQAAHMPDMLVLALDCLFLSLHLGWAAGTGC